MGHGGHTEHKIRLERNNDFIDSISNPDFNDEVAI